MNDRRALPEEIRDLLDEYCSGVIDDERLRALEAYLLADEAARREFVAYFHMHTELHFAVRAEQAADAVLGKIRSRSRGRGDRSLGMDRRGPGRRPRCRGLRPGPARRRREPPVVGRSSPPGPARARPQRRPHRPGRGAQARRRRWELADGPPLAEGAVLNAGRVRLSAGRVTLAFISGVTLTLEGPADVDLVTIDRVFCRRGKLRARVPDGYEGFVVTSPTSAVLDLGTEFALNIEADGTSRVRVFEGAVEAALLDPAGWQRQTLFVARDKSFELDPRIGRVSEAAAPPAAFVPAPDLAASSLDLDPAYPVAVLRSRPKGYWRFESLAGGAVPNEVAERVAVAHARPHRPFRRRAGQPVRRVQTGAPEQFLTTDRLWELAGEPGHAIEFWFWPENFHGATLVGLYPPRGLNPPARGDEYVHTFLIEVTAGERRSLHKPASVRSGHRWPLTLVVAHNTYSNLYVPRRWHHVVAQKCGGRMELYFDGVLNSPGDRLRLPDPALPPGGGAADTGRRGPAGCPPLRWPARRARRLRPPAVRRGGPRPLPAGDGEEPVPRVTRNHVPE